MTQSSMGVRYTMEKKTILMGHYGEFVAFDETQIAGFIAAELTDQTITIPESYRHNFMKVIFRVGK